VRDSLKCGGRVRVGWTVVITDFEVAQLLMSVGRVRLCSSWPLRPTWEDPTIHQQILILSGDLFSRGQNSLTVLQMIAYGKHFMLDDGTYCQISFHVVPKGDIDCQASLPMCQASVVSRTWWGWGGWFPVMLCALSLILRTS
jgi:hypothetical protein